MAGHSKFKNIMHRKGAQDARRAKKFARLIKELQVASRSGNDPDSNPRLRTALAACKSANMPKDNIEKILKKANSGEEDNLEEIRYEGYGPGGTAIIVEAVTDNRNRTASEVRASFAKHGGNLGETGSVSYLFKNVGQIIYNIENVEEEEVFAGNDHGDFSYDNVLLIFFASEDADEYRVMGTEDTVQVKEGTSGQKVGKLNTWKSTHANFIDGSNANALDEWWGGKSNITANPLEVNMKFVNFKASDGSCNGCEQEVKINYPCGFPWFSGGISCVGPNSASGSTDFEYKQLVKGTLNSGPSALIPANLGWQFVSGGKGGKGASQNIGVFNFADQSLVSATFLVHISYENNNLGNVLLTKDGSTKLTYDGTIAQGEPTGPGKEVTNPLSVSVNVPGVDCRHGSPVASHQLFTAEYGSDSGLDEGYYTLHQDFHIGVHHESDPMPPDDQKLNLCILFKVQKSAGQVTGKNPTKGGKSSNTHKSGKG